MNEEKVYDLAEVVFDLTWAYVHWHEKQSEQTKSDIMDVHDGSRGMFDFIYAKAQAFEVKVSNYPWGAGDLDYMEEVDKAGTEMLAEIAANIMQYA